MFKEDTKEIQLQVFKMIMISLVLAISLIMFFDYEPISTTLGMLFVNLSLLAAYFYTTRMQRPILFTTVFIFYLCLALYSWRYLENKVVMKGLLGLFIQAGTSTLLFLGCISIVFLEIKDLVQVVKRRIDRWFPPLYILVFGIFIFLEVNEQVSVDLKRASLFILSLGLIFVSFYKNDKKPSDTVYYDVTLKGYLRHLAIMLFVILIGIKVVPQLEYLPGAKWLQQYNKSLIGDLPSSVKLDRRPSLSENILFEVQSEEPLYLREIAYSHYDRGVWSIDKSDTRLTKISSNSFLGEYDLFLKITEPYLEKENIPIEGDKSAYIYELNNYRHYLTVNGLTGIYTNDDSVLVAGDINNICFQEGEDRKQVGYTINYVAKNPEIVEIFRYPDGVGNREDWLDWLEVLRGDIRNNTEPLFMSEETYNRLRTKYTQVPEQMAYNLNSFAKQLTSEAMSDVQKANTIEAYLRNSGEYTYVYGAPQKDIMADPVYDFIFNQKQGICQDFASGMVLLCRSIGLPTRYVCGYYSEEKDEKGKYIIREKNAHAFVEVYISGYGWMLFDPTPSSSQREEVGNNVAGVGNAGFDGIGVENELLSLGRKLLLPMLLLIPFVVLVRVLSYAYWKKKLLEGLPEIAIKRLIEATLKLLSQYDYDILPGETYEQLSRRLLKDQIDITAITKPYEACFYGRKSLTKLEIEEALRVYEYLRKRKAWKKR
ncbi:transglutaminase domain-containing protein [Cellulosilyticum sp. ST5]|uniref:transglutaminase family protein n=1 Tax=unclassified Cellulosilyticum TaxID=2643091 RepID=UPI000F8F3CCB|nr:transglutaminase domain-containing protein [Cellulosilyticum sp. WCF-2]QEH67031.1 transglutaminase domain-containing protein [Cellulosilyticum sp. WCF-2]